MFKLYRWFFLKETICRQPGKQVYQKVYRTAMSGMFNFADIFQFVVNCFYNRMFYEKDFISHGHRTIFHITFDAGNRMQSIFEKRKVGNLNINAASFSEPDISIILPI
jgi:hypothetical protein